MIGSKRIHRSATIAKFLLFACLVAASRLVFPQAQMNDDPQTSAMRKQALQLYREGKFVDAMPLLEKLAGINPSDFVVKEHWAYCVLEYSKTLTNPQERRHDNLDWKPRSLVTKANCYRCCCRSLKMDPT